MNAIKPYAKAIVGAAVAGSVLSAPRWPTAP